MAWSKVLCGNRSERLPSYSDPKPSEDDVKDEVKVRMGFLGLNADNRGGKAEEVSNAIQKNSSGSLGITNFRWKLHG